MAKKLFELIFSAIKCAFLSDYTPENPHLALLNRVGGPVRFSGAKSDKKSLFSITKI